VASAVEGGAGALAATDGRLPGKRGQATRRRLLESTNDLIRATPWRSIKVIDIAKAAGTSPATFYQYFENVEQVILVLAEELVEGAGTLADLVEGDWSDPVGWDTAQGVVDGFNAYWERNRAVFRVVELATEEGDLRFQGLRVRALNAVTVSIARAITLARAARAAGAGGVAGVAGAAGAGGAGGPAGAPGVDAGKRGARAGGSAGGPAGSDPMAVAATLVSMLAHVAAHRYGYEFWGIRTASMSDVQARLVYWAVTGREVDCDPADLELVAAPRTGAIVGGGAARATVEAARRRFKSDG
jgi:AcrR family transcriptional regulator